MIDFIENRPTKPQSPLTVLFAHGAGAPMDSPFMETIADLVCKRGILVKRFEFPYMAKRREQGGKRPPDRQPVLLECFTEAVDACGGPAQVVLAGKSMGGRMATLLACRLPVRGVVCLGYPFHAPGKPDAVRTDHFPELTCPVLILQGERDTFGNKTEVDHYPLPATVTLHWLTDGNHDLKPRKRSGISHEQHLATSANQLADFVLAV